MSAPTACTCTLSRWQFQVAERPAADEIVFACRRLADGSTIACPSDGKQQDAWKTAAPAPGDGLVIAGGYQECRGADIGHNQFYAENVLEELDDAREWFLRTPSEAGSSATLLYIPANGTNMATPGVLVAGAVLPQVVEVAGAASFTLRGVTVTHTAPTYMASYECPSGGDWAIHRGAAVFVEDSTNVTLEGIVFDQPSGNAVMFSNAVNSSNIRKCLFDRVGDSAVALLGSTALMLGLASEGSGKFPTANVIEANLVDTVGVYGKQTSAYFKSKARANIVRNNVFMNGPRAGVNFNDGSAGGEVLEGNLIFNFVRESGDHVRKGERLLVTLCNYIGCYERAATVLLHFY